MRNLSRGTIIVIFLFFGSLAQAVNSQDVLINEIAWVGSQTSPNDEWIELYNSTDSSINLEGWILKAVDGSPKINLTGTLVARSFYLLERTDDNTVPNVPTDQIYTGALSNTGEKLELYDNSGNLIDLVNCSSGWLAGDNVTKQTMEKTLSGNWQNSQNPGGTPKAKNSVFAETEIVENTETVEVKLQQTQPQQITYPFGIVINEILPSPEGPDSEEEWIEIYNQNNFEVDVSNWQITDTVGKTNTYAFPLGTKISAQGFLVPSRPITKITLNNDEDGLLLIQPNGNILDSVNYQKAPRGQSYNRAPLKNDSLTGQAESGWVWSSVLTPNSVNITSPPVVQNEITQKEKTESNKELQKNQSQKQQLAAISEQIPKENFSSVLIALSVAIFSGIIILVIKNKLS